MSKNWRVPILRFWCHDPVDTISRDVDVVSVILYVNHSERKYKKWYSLRLSMGNDSVDIKKPVSGTVDTTDVLGTVLILGTARILGTALNYGCAHRPIVYGARILEGSYTLFEVEEVAWRSGFGNLMSTRNTRSEPPHAER